jgi:predicted lipid carrier protein YhbT
MLAALPAHLQLLSNVKPFALRGAALMPFTVQRYVTERLLNPLLAEAIADGDLDLLRNRVLALCITETGQTWYLSLIDDSLQLVRHCKRADVCISGSFEAFLLISNQLEDPDTLFFQRELDIEGDTELGLTIKNCLHNVDSASLPTPVRHLLEAAGGIAQRIYQSCH